MKKILIAYATNSGSTEDVARVVAEELGRNGDRVDVRRTDEVASLQEYQAVVVGAPMILGWHRSAVKFVKTHRQVLGQVRVAYFSTAMSLTRTGDDPANGAVPLFIDPELANPPRNPSRLSLKERYARVSNYLRPMLAAAPGVRPVSVGFFGGKLELFRLKLLPMLFVMLVIGAQPGDRRNWPAIREWAARLRPALLDGEPQPG